MDGGGPSHEFWCCLAQDIEQSLCEAENGSKVLRHDAVALQASISYSSQQFNFIMVRKKDFFILVQLMALSLVHGSSGFPFLAKLKYEYLCGLTWSSITVANDEVPSYEVKALLNKVFFCLINFISTLSKLILQRIAMH